MLEVTIPFLPSNPLNGTGGHPLARARRRRREREGVWHVLLARLGYPAKVQPNFKAGAVVTMTRLSSGTLDDDNLRASLKAVRDELAKYLGHDDGAKSPLEWRYAQGKAPPKRGAVHVRIERKDLKP